MDALALHPTPFHPPHPLTLLNTYIQRKEEFGQKLNCLLWPLSYCTVSLSHPLPKGVKLSTFRMQMSEKSRPPSKVKQVPNQNQIKGIRPFALPRRVSAKMHLLVSDSSDKILFQGGRWQKYECICLQLLLLLQSVSSQNIKSKRWNECPPPTTQLLKSMNTLVPKSCCRVGFWMQGLAARRLFEINDSA